MKIPVMICSLTASSVASALVLGGVFQGLTPALAAASMVVGLLAAALSWKIVDPAPKVPLRFWDIAIFGIFGLAAFRAFFWVLYRDGERLMILSPNNLGDLSLHIGLIRYFASGVPFWPDNPIFAGQMLAYPPGADLFNSLLLLVGPGLREGLVLTGFVMALVAARALWNYGGAFCLAAFLLGGGLAGFGILKTGAFFDYSSGPEGVERIWKNPFLAMLVTQRGFLFALPAGLILLSAWKDEFFGDGRERLPFGFQFLLYATLPLFQVHTFLFLSGLLGASLLFLKTNRDRPLRLLAASFFPASAAVYFVTGGFSSGSQLRFEPAWSAPEGLSGFLLEFGLALLLAGILVYRVIRSGTPYSRWIVLVALAFALFAFLFPLHSWPWDNTKLLIWSWIVIAPFLWQYVLRPLPVFPRSSLCILLFFTGLVSLAAGLDRRHGYELANLKELRDWEFRTKNLPRDSVFAAEPDYNHPLILLGRPVLCGYEGHLSSHGLNYSDRLASLKSVLSMQPDWQATARKLGATHLALRYSPDREALLLPVPARADINN